MAKKPSPYSFDDASVYIDGKKVGKVLGCQMSYGDGSEPIPIKVTKNKHYTIIGTAKVMNPFYDWFMGEKMGYIQRAIAWLRKLLGRDKVYRIDTFWGHANFVKVALNLGDFDYKNPDSRKGELYHEHEDIFIMRWGGQGRDKKIGFVIQRTVHALQQRRYKLKNMTPYDFIPKVPWKKSGWRIVDKEN